MITVDLERDERMGWSTYKVRVDGLDLFLITDQTDKALVDRLQELCQPRWRELVSLVKAADECRAWNISHPGQGKDWPAFRNLERVRTELLNQAGIVDT